MTIDPAGPFVAGQRDIISPGMFIAGSILSDEQRRRQAVYESLLPVRIDRANLTIDVDAPRRPLEITTGAVADAAVLIRFDSPLGTVTFSTENPDLLQPDETGGLVFGVNVGDAREVIPASGPDGGRSAESFWHIRQIELDIAAEVLAAEVPGADMLEAEALGAELK